MPIQQYYVLPYDRWEGYAAERRRLLTFLSNKVKNVVFLTTDVHATLVNDARFQTLEPGGPRDSGILDVTVGPAATANFGLEIDTETGSMGTGALVDTVAFESAPPTGVGMRCSIVDQFSYGPVKVTSKRPDDYSQGSTASASATQQPCGPFVLSSALIARARAGRAGRSATACRDSLVGHSVATKTWRRRRSTQSRRRHTAGAQEHEQSHHRHGHAQQLGERRCERPLRGVDPGAENRRAGEEHGAGQQKQQRGGSVTEVLAVHEADQWPREQRQDAGQHGGHGQRGPQGAHHLERSTLGLLCGGREHDPGEGVGQLMDDQRELVATE